MTADAIHMAQMISAPVRDAGHVVDTRWVVRAILHLIANTKLTKEIK